MVGKTSFNFWVLKYNSSCWKWFRIVVLRTVLKIFFLWNIFGFVAKLAYVSRCLLKFQTGVFILDKEPPPFPSLFLKYSHACEHLRIQIHWYNYVPKKKKRKKKSPTARLINSCIFQLQILFYWTHLDSNLFFSSLFFQMGGRSLVENEVLCRFVFPERPGALMKFLDTFSPRWNISLFHYRGQVGF